MDLVRGSCADHVSVIGWEWYVGAISVYGGSASAGGGELMEGLRGGSAGGAGRDAGGGASCSCPGR